MRAQGNVLVKGENMPQVRNVKTYDKSVRHDVPFVSITRGTPWANPFIEGRDGDRVRVIMLFAAYARWRKNIQPTWLDKLIGKDLLCSCAPDPCHGDVLLKLVKEREFELIRKKRIKPTIVELKAPTEEELLKVLNNKEEIFLEVTKTLGVRKSSAQREYERE